MRIHPDPDPQQWAKDCINTIISDLGFNAGPSRSGFVKILQNVTCCIRIPIRIPNADRDPDSGGDLNVDSGGPRSTTLGK